MKVLAVLLAAYIGGINPIELWRSPLPIAYMELRVFNRVVYAPSPYYFNNMATGCNIVAEDIKSVDTCKHTVKMMSELSQLFIAELRHASITRFGSEKFTWRDTVKAAQENAAKLERLYEPLLQRYPALHAIGLGGETIRT